MKLILSIILFLALSFIPSEAHAFVGMAIGAVAGAAFGTFFGASFGIGAFFEIAYAAGSLGGILLGAAGGTVLGGMASLGKLFAPDVPEVGYDSPTYGGNQPNVTVEEGTPIAKPYGLGILGGNIIRQNDVKEADYIKFIVTHGQGTIGSFLGAWVNDVEWTDLSNANHAKWSHIGESSQSGVTNLFTDGEVCNYRGLALTEVKLKKGDEIPQLQNFLTIARWKKCLNIGQDAGGATSWTHNNAQVLWDWYITVEGYAAAALNTNAFTALSLYCTTLQTSDESMPFRPPISSDDLVMEAARTDNKRFKAKYGLKFDKSLVDAPDWNSWREQATTAKRINIDFGRPVVITKMVLENYHSTGAEVDVGINAFIVQGSNNAASMASTTYASTGWTDLLSTSAAAHTASNVVDPETFAITNSTAYRYYALKVATNQGDATYMGLRDLTFYGHTPRYTFDYTFDAKITINDAKKILWSSFNGKAVMSQGTIKPVWDAAEEHDGAAGLQTKAVSHTFTMDNVVKGSLVWGRLNNPNIVRVYYLNSAENYKKDVVEIKDEQDIARRGEVIFEDNCWYITDAATAIRRAKLKFNKSRYTGWMCELTGFPDAQDLEEYDRVAVTNTLPGWTNKDFIVIQRDEDQWGRPKFYLEEYISGIYSDEGFELQGGVRSNLPNVYQPSPHPSDTAAAFTAVGAGAYSAGKVSITFTPPNHPYYSHSRVLLSTDDTTYYQVGNSSGSGAFNFNGMGVLYQPGDTAYVKIQTVNVNGVMEPIPSAYDISCVIGGSIRISSFYFGTYDMWGGNATLANAATTIVLGNLDGTSKIALGASAETLDINNMATYPGFFADGAGNVRAGNAGGGFVSTGGAFTVTGALAAATIDIGGDDATSFHVDIGGGIWSGASIANKATAPFRVSSAGGVVCTSITLTGLQAGSAIDGQYLNALSVATGALANLAITAGKIDNLTITAAQIANLTITSTQIANSTITATQIANDTLTAVKLKIGVQTWSHDIVFSSTDLDTVTWAAGTITMADAATYSIVTGNTGNMAARTYIYLDIAVSTTILQITTTAGTAVGDGKVLIAVAINGAAEAEFQVFGGVGGLNINGSNVVANTITANEIAANTITATEIAAATITASQIKGTDFGTLTISSGKIAINATDALEIQAAGNVKVLAGADILFEHGGDIKFTSVTAPTACTGALAGAGAGNVDNGDHYYKITYVNAAGETELGTASAVVTVVDKAANGQVSLTAIPVSISSSVTSRKIYRTKAGGTDYYYLAEIANNTGTTYTDNIADASLGADSYNNKYNDSFGKYYVDGVSRLELGKYDVFIGQDAGTHNTTGYGNIAIGYNALHVNITGWENIAIGYDALRNNIGYQNTAIGAHALHGYLNDTGHGNTAIGYSALTNNTIGYDNVAIGKYSLNDNTEGYSNIAIGRGSLYSNTTGDENTAIGRYSIYGNTLGNRNIGLGYCAGRYETGSDTFYVNNQDRSNNAGDRTLSLLYGVMAAAAADQTLVINAGSVTLTGNIVMANNATIGQAAGPLIAFDDTNNYLEITGCNVGIGTTAPTAPLTVAQYAGGGITTQGNLGTTGNTINLISGYAWGLTDTTYGSGIKTITESAGLNTYGLGIWTRSAYNGTYEERVRVAGSGNVGIGATVPISLTEIQGGLTTVGAILTLSSKETSTVANDILGRINFRAALDASGGDAILTGASIAAIAEATFSASVNSTGLQFSTGTSEVATEKMRLDHSGNLIIGDIASTYKFKVVGSLATNIAHFHNDGNANTRYGIAVAAGLDIGGSGADANYCYDCQDGDLTEHGGVRITSGTVELWQSSDETLKENIIEEQDIDSLAKFRELKLYKYNLKKGGAEKFSPIAQQMMQVFPSSVGEKNGLLNIGYGEIQVHTVNAIKQLDNETIILKSRIQEIEQEIQELKAA